VANVSQGLPYIRLVLVVERLRVTVGKKLMGQLPAPFVPHVLLETAVEQAFVHVLQGEKEGGRAGGRKGGAQGGREGERKEGTWEGGSGTSVKGEGGG